MPTTFEIKSYLENVSIDDLPKELEKFSDDSRESVKKLVDKFKNKYEKHLKEILRLKKMCEFEYEYFNKGLELIGGIDEVGRGPLCGPVVASCVIFPKDFLKDEKNLLFLEGINDSKKVNEKKREILYDEIYKRASYVGIGMVDNEIIDEINILNATIEAMKISVENLPIVPDLLLIDAVRIKELEIVQHPIIGGDGKSISIAAASIVAKVTRDRLMKGYALEYPEYDFENNKGYGTEKHYEAIKKFGMISIHRKSFLKNFL